MDRVIKISNWPQAAVAIAGMLAVVGVVWSLSHAGVPLEVIIGAAMAVLGVSGGQMAIARRAASTEAKTDDQSQQLATIVRQTNGITEKEREAIADAAADKAAVKVVEAWRRGDM